MEMTKEVLVKSCKQNGGYAAPRLNDQLFLQCRGFLEIKNLDEYVNLKVLWLEQNAITELFGMEKLQQLVSLLLQNNTIRSLQTLPTLKNLRILNVSHNYLTSLDGLAHGCPLLETFQAAHNHISSFDALADLLCLKETLTSVDISYNKIGDDVDDSPLNPDSQKGGMTVDDVADFFTQLPLVSVIYLNGNSLVRRLRSYRRTMIVRLPALTYLDERPVFAEERRATEAWGVGGDEAERKERCVIRDEKKAHLTSCVRLLTDQLDANREVRDRLTAQWNQRRDEEREQYNVRCAQRRKEIEELEMKEFDVRANLVSWEVSDWKELSYDMTEAKEVVSAQEKETAAALASSAIPCTPAEGEGECSEPRADEQKEHEDNGKGSDPPHNNGGVESNAEIKTTEPFAPSLETKDHTGNEDEDGEGEGEVDEEYDNLLQCLGISRRSTLSNGECQDAVSNAGHEKASKSSSRRVSSATGGTKHADMFADSGAFEGADPSLEWLTRPDKECADNALADLQDLLNALQPYAGKRPSNRNSTAGVKPTLQKAD